MLWIIHLSILLYLWRLRGRGGAPNRTEPGMESDRPLGWIWCLQHLADGGKNSLKFRVVRRFHFEELSAQMFVSGEQGPEWKESQC